MSVLKAPIDVILVEFLGESRDKGDLLRRWDLASRSADLRGVTFVGSIPGGVTLLPERIDLGGPAIFSLLRGDEVVFLNKRIRRSMRIWGSARFPLDHTISFDTQFISYFADLLRGRSHPLEPVVRHVLTFAAVRHLNWDVSVFYQENRQAIIENGVEGNAQLRRNLYAAEYLKALDEDHYLKTGKLRAHLSESRLWAEVKKRVEFNRKQDLEWLDAFHEPIYAALLKVASIEFAHRRGDVEKKILALLTFFQEELGTLMLRELVIASHFFERGTALGFFSRVQRGHKRLLETLKNMAFDLQISRMQEVYMQVHFAQGQYLLPYFLTFDKHLIEVLDLYPLTACLFSGQDYMPYSAFDIEAFLAQRLSKSQEMSRRFFNLDAHLQRRAVHGTRQHTLAELVKRLEEEVLSY